jgi:replication-associated recombination protein RarA
VIYLAVAAKSNAGYNAYNAARAFVKQDGSRPVPVHLRNAPTKLMKDLGFGKEYRYAHDEPEAYAAGETYLPDGMAEPAGTSRRRAGWKARSARSWRTCASSTARPARNKALSSRT